MLPSLLVAVLATSAPVPKSGVIDLSWKFTKGDTVEVFQTCRRQCTADLGGMEFKSVTATVIVYRLAVTETDARRTVLDLRFVGGLHRTAANDGKWLPEPIPSLKGRSVSVTLDADRRVSKIEGADSPDATLAAMGWAREDVIRDSLTELLTVVPGKVVAICGTWEAERTERPTNTMTKKRLERGTVGMVEDGSARLSIETDLTLIDGTPPTGVSRLEATKVPKTVAFDAKRGRVCSVKEECELVGDADETPNGGPKVPLKVKLTQGITIRDVKK